MTEVRMPVNVHAFSRIVPQTSSKHANRHSPAKIFVSAKNDSKQQPLHGIRELNNRGADQKKDHRADAVAWRKWQESTSSTRPSAIHHRSIHRIQHPADESIQKK